MRETLPIGMHRVYDRLVAKRLAVFYDRLARQNPDASCILDVGCGPGQFALSLARHHPGARVVGIDLDPAQVRIANRKQRQKPTPERVEYLQGDSRRMDFADATFDWVVTTESFHHWRGQAVALEEVHRVLRPGGRLWIVEGAGDMDKEEIQAWSGKRPLPGYTMLARFVFRTHGYTPQRLHSHVLPMLEASPFGGASVSRRDGWWIIEATRTD